jgi:hopanoid biosynthesis associated RND transporter like protein HpnN
MTSYTDSLFARALRILARALCKHPRWFVIPQLILFVVSVVYTCYNLKTDFSRDNLVGPNQRYQSNFLKYRQEFPGEDELVVVVESDNFERNRQFVERLSAKLSKETNLFTDVFFKGDLSALGNKALLMVPENDLQDLVKALGDYRPFIREFTQATNLDSFFELINQTIRTSDRESNEKTDALLKAFPAFQRIVAQARDSIMRTGQAPSPGVSALFGTSAEDEQKIYITFANGQIFLATAKARDKDLNEKAVDRMRQLIQETEIEVPGLNIGLTGEPVLEYDEMKQSEHDSIVASIASLVICSLIFIYAYRQTGRPLKAVACLLMGLGFTMGFTTLVVGHLNILTITFAPILIGLAIDFGIHYITRYEEETRHGHSVEDAIFKATVYTGQGIITGALTTAVAFLAMGITNFKGIQEMGIIAGGGLVLCLLPMMTVLPHLLAHGHQNQLDKAQAGAVVEKRARIESLWLDRPWRVMLLTALLCAASVWCFHKVYFDYNLLHMQSQGLPAVVYEQKLIKSANKSVIFAAVVADNPDEAHKFAEAIKKLPSVAVKESDNKKTCEKEIDMLADYFRENQTGKLTLVGQIKKIASEFHFAPMDTSPVDVHKLSTTLYYLNGYLLAMSQDADLQREKPELLEQIRTLHQTVSDFRVLLSSGNAETRERISNYQRSMFQDLHNTFEGLTRQDNSGPLRPENLPPTLKDRFVGITGKQLLMVYPAKDVWNHDNQKEFIRELRSVIPEDKVTGTPIQLYEYTTLLKDSYQEAAKYSLIAIAIMVLLHFRSISCVILALFPVAIGTTWMLGLMGIFGIPFNPANIMTLPLVIGIGVTNGIHILNRFAEEQKPGMLAKSTGKAVLVSGLTAVAGFGSLMLAKHQGIQSLGFVMSVGIATCMLAGLTFLPALLVILSRWGWRLHTKRPSNDNARSAPGPEEPR